MQTHKPLYSTLYPELLTLRSKYGPAPTQAMSLPSTCVGISSMLDHGEHGWVPTRRLIRLPPLRLPPTWPRHAKAWGSCKPFQ